VNRPEAASPPGQTMAEYGVVLAAITIAVFGERTRVTLND
jgi:hypothetical protein